MRSRRSAPVIDGPTLVSGLLLLTAALTLLTFVVWPLLRPAVAGLAAGDRADAPTASIAAPRIEPKALRALVGRHRTRLQQLLRHSQARAGTAVAASAPSQEAVTRALGHVAAAEAALTDESPAALARAVRNLRGACRQVGGALEGCPPAAGPLAMAAGSGGVEIDHEGAASQAEGLALLESAVPSDEGAVTLEESEMPAHAPAARRASPENDEETEEAPNGGDGSGDDGSGDDGSGDDGSGALMPGGDLNPLGDLPPPPPSQSPTL